MGTHRHGYGEVLRAVERRTGLAFEMFNSGGGVMIFEARLETGHYVWISDADAGVWPLPCRREMEAAGTAVGYHLAVYPPFTEPERAAEVYGGTAADYGEDSKIQWRGDCDSNRCAASVHHGTASAEQLPELVELVVSSLPRNAHHNINAGEFGRTAGTDLPCPCERGQLVCKGGAHTVTYGVDDY